MLLSLVNLKIKRKLNLQHLAHCSKIKLVQENALQTIQANYPAQNLLKQIQKLIETHLQSAFFVLQVRKKL